MAGLGLGLHHEHVDVPVPAPLVDLYQAVGRQWTVAMFAALGLALLTYGIFAWWRERARAPEGAAPRTAR